VQQQQATRCGAVGVLNTYGTQTSGRFRALRPVGFSNEKFGSTDSPAQKIRRFRSCPGVPPETALRRRKTARHVRKRFATSAHSVTRGLNLFSLRVGTLVSSVTHYLKTSRRRDPRAGGRLRRSRNYCCADELTGSGRQ